MSPGPNITVPLFAIECSCKSDSIIQDGVVVDETVESLVVDSEVPSGLALAELLIERVTNAASVKILVMKDFTP